MNWFHKIQNINAVRLALYNCIIKAKSAEYIAILESYCYEID